MDFIIFIRFDDNLFIKRRLVTVPMFILFRSCWRVLTFWIFYKWYFPAYITVIFAIEQNGDVFFDTRNDIVIRRNELRQVNRVLFLCIATFLSSNSFKSTSPDKIAKCEPRVPQKIVKTFFIFSLPSYPFSNLPPLVFRWSTNILHRESYQS